MNVYKELTLTAFDPTYPLLTTELLHPRKLEKHWQASDDILLFYYNSKSQREYSDPLIVLQAEPLLESSQHHFNCQSISKAESLATITAHASFNKESLLYLNFY